MDNATNAKVIGRGVFLTLRIERLIRSTMPTKSRLMGSSLMTTAMAITAAMGLISEMPPMSTVNNFKAYSFNRWSDGIDIFASQYVTINDYFTRTGDDAIAIYGARNFGGNNYSGNTTHISVTNSFLSPMLLILSISVLMAFHRRLAAAIPLKISISRIWTIWQK